MKTTIIEKEKLIEKYLAQPAKLPEQVKEVLNSEEALAYALIDGIVEQSNEETWLILTSTRICNLSTLNNDRVKTNWEVDLNQIEAVKEFDHVTFRQVVFVSKGKSCARSIHFSRRQQAAVSNITFLVEDYIENKHFKVKGRSDELYQESLVKSIEENLSATKDKDTQTLKRLLSYLKPYKVHFLWGGVGSIGLTILGLMPAYLTGRIIDKVVKPYQDGVLDVEAAKKLALILVAGLGASYLFREFFIWLRLKKMSVIGEWVARDLRRDLYEHLHKLGLDFFGRTPTGSIISRVSSDTDRIWDFIAFGIIEVAISIVTLTGICAMLLTLDWRLGLVMTIPVPFLLLAIAIHGKTMQKIFIKAWRKWSNISAILSDVIPGMQVVKAFNQQEKEINRFNSNNEWVTDEFQNVHNAWTKFWPLLMLSIHILIVVIWTMGLPRLLSPEQSANHLSAGVFVSFLLYLTMFAAPIEIIGQMARMLNRALSSAQRIFDILDTEPTQKEAKNPVKFNKLEGKIEFKQVGFSYDGVRDVLKDVSFTIEPGEMIGLVGVSGSGKTTITKLIARYFDITKGQIKIDGVDINTLDISSFRNHIGIVSQEPYLFHGTVADNIAYGIENASRKDIIDSARKANAHDFIMRLPNGYDTLVGERGQTLSGGERQRIAIARAILKNPKILILDEATSAVDTETERKIQSAIDNLIKDKTVIAIAHRLSTLAKANRLLVMEKGELIEQGPQEELLKKKDGQYAKLYNLQQENNEYLTMQ